MHRPPRALLVTADQLLAQCEQAHADLQALAELRQHASCRLDQLGGMITELRGLEEETSVQRRLNRNERRLNPDPPRAIRDL